MTSFAAPRLTTGTRRPRLSVASLVRAAGAARAPRTSWVPDAAHPARSSNTTIAAMTLPRF